MKQASAPAVVKKPFGFEGLLYGLSLFMCPLVFFTDLTRNPYYTQITLLNIFICLLLGCKLLDAWRQNRWTYNRGAADLPWVLWLLWCIAGCAHAYFTHTDFFRPAIISEASRVWLFTVVNCFFVYWLGKSLKVADRPFDRSLVFPLLLILWGFLWFLYPDLHAPLDPSNTSALAHIFDPYGTCVWGLGLALVYFAARDGSFDILLNVAFAGGAIASGYGILQTFGYEWVWPKMLNPYGARAVSTFGNPNFLSSYLVMLLPFAWVYYVRQTGFARRLYYGLLFLVYCASLLASMTRSSWIGAFVAMAFLLLLKEERKLALAAKKAALFLALPAVLMVFFWPSSNVGDYHPTVIQRVRELSGMRSAVAGLPAANGQVYSPWHQRVLIWETCVNMGLENPVIGKGWGLLELFYPFYQGPMLVEHQVARQLRTHANNAHNELVELFCQTGIVGVGLFVWLLTALFFAFAKYYRNREGDKAAIAAACAAALAGMLADNLLNVSLHFAIPGFLFWLLAGTLAGLCAGEEAIEFISWTKPALSRALAACGLVALLAVGWIWVCQWQRERLYFAGFKLTHAGDPQRAQDYLEKAYDSFSRDVNTNYELASAYLQQGNVDKALWAYNESLRANSGYDEIYFNVAAVLFKKANKPQDAFSYALTSIWINPLNVQTFDLMSDMARTIGGEYPGRAAQVMLANLPVYGESQNYLNTLAYFISSTGDQKKAREYFIRALDLDPVNQMVEANLRRADTALKISRDPALDRAAQLRDMEIRLASGDHSDAMLLQMQNYCTQQPGQDYAAVMLARLLILRGDSVGARNIISTVLAAHPDSPVAKTALAGLEAQNGNQDTARGLLREVLGYNPADQHAKHLLDMLNSQPAPQK